MRIHLTWELTRLYVLLGSERCGFKSWLLSASYLNISEYWRDEFPELHFPSTGKLRLWLGYHYITYCGYFFIKLCHCWYYYSLKAKKGGSARMAIICEWEETCILDVHWFQAFDRSPVTLNLCIMYCAVHFFGLGVLALKLTGCCLEREKAVPLGEMRGFFSLETRIPFWIWQREVNSPVSKVSDSESDLETASSRNNGKILLLIR